MTAPADMFNSRTDSSTRPITLTATLAAIDRVLDAVDELAEVEPRLRTRIEAARQRDARRRGVAVAKANGNGHRGDLAVKLTRHGLLLVCRSCGTPMLASHHNNDTKQAPA